MKDKSLLVLFVEDSEEERNFPGCVNLSSHKKFAEKVNLFKNAAKYKSNRKGQ